jgi:DNA-binding transcriptional ArsR family regulator
MEHHHEENVLREVPDLDTLQELLSRLNEVEHYKPVSRSEKITVEDIAEALNLDANHVARELEAILEEHRDARLAGVIRELEEPLYRVERAGHQVHDPLGNPLFKLRSVKLLTDKNREKSALPRRELKETDSDRLGHWIGKFMIILMFSLMAILVIKALVVIAIQK